ncbi:NhaP-type Na+/H+ or K+/H+ antiporter [Nonlabens xylanidelens]|uniref:NhaP-type Na+/H+ or K+/H+ antiporter n=1 Tax=Nonlabens xylanidelens TaxID=191564 RepID=A0A2S6IQL5_9FLAO|nr:cation:proton antiporter [Nonlabens xylanidelens]PPK96498.1 NhaP-type Na+/H+ or K+/H+ antiporter [Nonlabens xylanidelens]PQJ18216.1 cell shape-determining protein [Nonlabens xylanidelens]
MLELAGIIILGILAQWMAWRLKIPAILPLIIIGLLVGPIASLYTADASKIIEPMWNGENGLFPGDSLFYFVSLAISIILFEGGLTLKRDEILNTGPVIGKLISVAVIITFVGGGVAAHYIFGLTWKISLLFSALIIVTGPTVITPILRNIPLKKDVSSILKWEGILIDPIGALFAVLVFEFISAGAGGEFTLVALEEFGKIVLFGFSFGFSFAHALAFSIKKKLIPHYLLNVFTLAAVLGVFVLSDSFAHESGLLSVVVMGMVLGNINLPNIKELLYFKESLSVLLISILFILLAANINMEDLYLIYRWETLVLFAIMAFIIRPLGVFASSINSGLKLNEKLFISWVGPRGIVAAGIASLFGSKLVSQGIPGAEYITPLVFMIVLGTVLLNATTARMFAKIVGVFLKQSNGIMIVGASKFSRVIAKYLKEHGRSVVLVDTNANNIRIAKESGLDAVTADIYSDSISDDIEFNNIGFLLALTGNSQINDYAIERFEKRFGENGAYRLVHSNEINNPNKNPVTGLFSATDDYVNMMEVTRHHGKIHEITIKSQEHFEGLIEITKTDEDIVPLFIRHDNAIDIVPSMSGKMEIEEGSILAYIGKEIVEQASGEVTMEEEQD